MQTTQYSQDANLRPRHSSYSIYKRLVNLVLVVVAGILCINLWLLSTDQALQWHDKQANQLGRSLVQMGARQLVQPLADKNTDALQFVLNNLNSDRHVLGASLYNHQGRLLHSTDKGVSLLTNYKLRQQVPLVFVEPVRRDNQILGYLRILLDEDHVMAHHQAYQRQLAEQLLVFMLLAGTAGMLVTRMFYKWRYRDLRRAKASAKAG
ncbi:hypothetical protein LJ739_00445 [Aestuariibacter halophilus]|uniref:Smp protein n=1 Tax=Fluctibacter halophilus TaxID=226011 RepID=A0ABS8G299_9ALTE|nr:AhpA/YtjB family protein [Aestuariibacter halophilus]MCC2614707.1 hypothetical protein [Aestuariibacter halophilus]